MGSGGIAPPFLTSAVDGDEWLASRLEPIYRQEAGKLGGPQSRSGIEKCLLPMPGIESRRPTP
jgi:hypothetical protein